jgi:sn-glycerol 3-phosphate transport system ATP-binding protein
MAVITLDSVKVVRSATLVLDIDYLEIEDGELLVLLGRSGAGKSTLLRAIAGLQPLNGGTILFDGVDMATVDPAKRGVAMVFQNDALYPFLDVRGNVGFPLKMRRVPAAELTARVEAEARVLEIEHLLARKPGDLSAGHQQLVQAARALVRVPHVFLMDEPLARLDAHLRVQMRQELRLLQQGYGVTTLFVTNDQAEAMVMADRIAVIDRGTILQIGAPLDLYRRPRNRFVAGFVGSMGFVGASVIRDGAGFWVRFGDFALRAWTPSLARVATVTVGIRPEDVLRDPGGVAVTVGRGWFGGADGAAQVELAPGEWLEMRTRDLPPHPGSRVTVRLRRLHLFDPTTGELVGRIEEEPI